MIVDCIFSIVYCFGIAFADAVLADSFPARRDARNDNRCPLSFRPEARRAVAEESIKKAIAEEPALSVAERAIPFKAGRGGICKTMRDKQVGLR